MPTCKNVHFSFNLKLSRNRNKIEEALFMTNNQLLGKKVLPYQQEDGQDYQ